MQGPRVPRRSGTRESAEDCQQAVNDRKKDAQTSKKNCTEDNITSALKYVDRAANTDRNKIGDWPY